MTRPEPEQELLLARLRAALDNLPPDQIVELIGEARAEARSEVRRLLASAMTDSMLAQVEAHLAPPRPTTPPMATEPPATPKATEPPATPRTTEPPARPKATQPSSPSSGGAGVYVYGVVPAGTELPDRLRGIDPIAPPRLLRHGDLAAVVSKVSLNEFEEERLREHLSDMAWVEATARAHELVLEMVGEVATLIPMRMCSVYRTEGGVKEMLARESTPLNEALDHLRGKSEWGVKVFAEGPASVDAQAPAQDDAQSGTDYMRKRKDERDARSSADERLREACMEIHDQLAGVTVDSRTAPLQRPEITGRDGEMLLNGVYLVESDQQQAFLGLVDKLRTEYAPLDLDLEPTGPWPAYNFVPGTIGAAW